MGRYQQQPSATHAQSQQPIATDNDSLPTIRSRSGHNAERAAARYLELRGLSVIEQNFRCRVGEIDLIAWDQAELVFVEVRLRNHPAYGSGADSVTRRKQGKLLRAARFYLLRHADHYREEPVCRFDVLSMRQPNYATRARWQVLWIKDAFSL